MSASKHDPMTMPDGLLDELAALAHEAWVTEKVRQGMTSRLSEFGEEMMQPYDRLSDRAKELSREPVKAVLEGLFKLGYRIVRPGV